MAETLTMMAVHAHPDDEASSTGGVLASYAAQGIRTVVVTCTNGEFGDAQGGVKPGQDGHDEQAVARLRLAELRESCAILGVTDLELLGYHDSGMPEWDYKDRPDAFCNIPQAQVAARISGLIERYRPQVLVTYDANGFYGHPDHIQAHRVAWRAFELAGPEGPAKFYATAGPDSDQVTTEIDGEAYFGQKLAAMRAHATQITVSPPYFALSDGIQRLARGVECYTLLAGPRGPGDREADLFGQ